MLELRPCCEHCGTDLPPNATNAMICSFECTFCADCVALLENVCPNCGGGFTPRPVRPANNLRNENYLGKYPASKKRHHRPVDLHWHRAFRTGIKNTPPESR